MSTTRHPLYAIVDRNGDEIGPRYGGRDGYADADDYRRANNVAHPTAQVVDARDLPRLPRLGGR